MAYIFLSHSHHDKPFARKVAADIRASGHTVWIDEAEINVGDSLIEKISDGLEQVDFVAAILSEASLDSAWVQKELEIASSREIEEKRVVVMPLLLGDVELPRFLKGKFYADFRKEENYTAAIKLVLRGLGDVEPIPKSPDNEIALLKAELAKVRELASRQERSVQRASEAAFQGKSEKLKTVIEAANKKHPSHAPINRTYAFEIGSSEVGSSIVTLDYALWALAKAQREGTHVLEALLTMHNRWQDLENMFSAYSDMLDSQEQN